jgi:hypothetical protein
MIKRFQDSRIQKPVEESSNPGPLPAKVLVEELNFIFGERHEKSSYLLAVFRPFPSGL